METNDILLEAACKIVAAYLRNNHVAPNELSAMIKNIHHTLGSLVGSSQAEPAIAQKPAISIRKSITPDYIICLEDGKKLKMLKRYLRTRFGMSPEEYRSKWGLPADYPLVAPNYAARRSEFAKKIGLGRRTSAPQKRRKR
ncbi:MAG TPA: MucR family transcriptional regulator [Rhizomicrobium sp.]|nr:MucR family transcriptional regulator [Rhizomicrobium sp.]